MTSKLFHDVIIAVYYIMSFSAGDSNADGMAANFLCFIFAHNIAFLCSYLFEENYDLRICCDFDHDIKLYKGLDYIHFCLNYALGFR